MQIDFRLSVYPHYNPIQVKYDLLYFKFAKRFSNVPFIVNQDRQMMEKIEGESK